MTALRYGVSDTLVLARRSLLRIPRQPDLLVGFTVQPILFVLLFVYVFGGAIQTPGFDYVDFLMPGIIVQSICFGGFVTALGLADDLKKGLMDRFRSLPMTRSALLTGRTLGDVVTNVFQLVVMLAVGLLVGFNFSGSVGEVIAGIALLPADRLCVLVGVRVHRAHGVVARGRERVRVHDPLPADVRLLRVRSRRLDAELAATVRGATTRSRTWSTRSVRCSSGFRPGTTSGWRWSGRSRSSSSSHRSRRGATGGS